MRRAFPAVALALACAAVVACRDRGDKQATAAPSAAHATAPEGDAGDICSHGVLASVCPKCNPQLAPIFQAKGDWCAEHGLPESFCPVCHPQRGGRPNADVSVKDGPADRMKVRLKTADISEKAGLRTVKAEARPRGGGLVVPARIAYDATRLAHVNARMGGVVRALHVDVGAKVTRGQPLAMLESANVGAERSRLDAAQARVGVAQKNLDRVAALKKSGFAAQTEVLAAEQELAAANADLRTAQTALSMAGAAPGGGSTYGLTSPLAGIVTRRSATVGELVRPEELVFEVVDTSAMWAELNVGEGDIAKVRVGQQAIVELDALPGKSFDGRVSFVTPEIDPQTRTGRVRVPLANPDATLRANMFAQARIVGDALGEAVLVPEAAVQRAKSVDVVFVKLEPTVFETRHVKIGGREGGMLEIASGIRAGEEVVTAGSFLLKTETMKESIGSGCCEGD